MQNGYEISVEIPLKLNFPQQINILIHRKSGKKGEMYFENTGEMVRR